MKSHSTGYALRFLALLCLVVGCATLKPPNVRDEYYPTEWPDISPLHVECKELGGTYSSSGTITIGNGYVRSISIADLFQPGRSSSYGNTFTLRIETKGFDRFNKNVTGTTLFIDGRPLPGFCACIETALCCPDISHSSGSFGIIAASGSQRNVWLTRAIDGSLLIKIKEYSAGLVLLVPYYQQKHSWARFDRINE